ncbi:MAG TPA: CvpA family protein [Bryobacteraceae bacterium]|jgi:membrane protein required for colicin V production|nr:CvpA family protein [Bryobacteraceae bacterium]
MSNIHINWFDIFLMLVIFASFVSGLRSGFARVVVGLVSTFFGLLAGFWFYRMLAPKLLPWVKTPTAANMLAFLLIFIGVLIVGSLIAAILSKLFSWIGLSWFNHLMGGAVGVLRGALTAAALVAVVIAFSPSPAPSFLNDSRVAPYATHVAGWLADLAPRELKDAFNQQIDNLKQLWTPPPSGRGSIA